jgi:hypothetical protein
MARHPHVTAAAKAHADGAHVFQCTLVLSGHIGPQPVSHSLPTKADDVNAVLNDLWAAGWRVVSTAVLQHQGSTATVMTYVLQRR